ncbi:MAG: GntR family transcriptional regulator [Pedosphaera sp.]|nr:GntR family transcriptional regulator [Pedosphaera sp.]
MGFVNRIPANRVSCDFESPPAPPTSRYQRHFTPANFPPKRWGAQHSAPLTRALFHGKVESLGEHRCIPMGNLVSSDKAYQFIRKRILSGEYPLGQPLISHTLAVEMGMSRTPVRDALRQLEADGLVVISPHVGARVKKVDLAEFQEVCDLRLALETHAASLAARRRTDVDLQAISVALEAMRELTQRLESVEEEETVLHALIREDVRFHMAIIAASKNNLIKKEILRFHLINRVVSTPDAALAGIPVPSPKSDTKDRRQAALACHTDIYKALERGDASSARSAMELHIQGIIDSTMHLVAGAKGKTISKELTEEELLYSS